MDRHKPVYLPETPSNTDTPHPPKNPTTNKQTKNPDTYTHTPPPPTHPPENKNKKHTQKNNHPQNPKQFQQWKLTERGTQTVSQATLYMYTMTDRQPGAHTLTVLCSQGGQQRKLVTLGKVRFSLVSHTSNQPNQSTSILPSTGWSCQKTKQKTTDKPLCRDQRSGLWLWQHALPVRLTLPSAPGHCNKDGH